MQILLLLIAAAVAAVQTIGDESRSDPLLVTRVTSGDTIVVSGLGSVRLLGIEASRTRRDGRMSAAFSSEAEERLASLVLHRWIRLVRGTTGRPLGGCVWTEDGQFVNAVLVREGLARASAKPAPCGAEALERAQADAQAAHRGIWRGTLDP